MLEGTTDNAAGSGAAPAASGNITSGTASEAMIKAATTASSAEAAPAVNLTGDTAKPAGDGTSGATSDATGQPVPTGQPAATGTAEAPQARIEAAVRNARAEVESKYAWAKGITPEQQRDIPTSLGIIRELRSNALGFWRRLGQELGQNVQAPAAAAAVVEEKEEAFPEPMLRSEDGKGAYSDGQVREIAAMLRRQITKELRGEMKPMTEFFDKEQTSREERASNERSMRKAGWAMTEARKLPHFTKENEPAILAKLEAIPAEIKREIGGVAALHMAYNQFLAETIFPNIETAADARVRASYDKKAAASRGQVHPTDQGGEGKSVEIKGVDGLARHMERLAAAAG